MPIAPAQPDPDYASFDGMMVPSATAMSAFPPVPAAELGAEQIHRTTADQNLPPRFPGPEDLSRIAFDDTNVPPHLSSHPRPPTASPADHTLRARARGTRPTTRAEEGYWFSDDEASIGDSDNERVAARQQTGLQTNADGALIARQLSDVLDHRQQNMRTFRPFACQDILATYFPSSTNSPLNDPQTAAVFWYFVNATGLCMSLYERHPLDPGPMFQGRPVPKARQHIWTCKLCVPEAPPRSFFFFFFFWHTC
jgi:hypothetical protein